VLLLRIRRICKMKKLRIYAAALALSALLLNGCSGLFLEKSPDSSGSGAVSPDIPEGFGTVTVSFSRGPARTVMPAADLDYLFLEYRFAKDEGAPEEKAPEGGRFVLEPGAYTLTVKAFADNGHNDLAAQGTSASFTITAGADAGTVDVALSPAVTGEGTGSLKFTIGYPAGVTVETLALTPLFGEEEAIDLNDPALTPEGTDHLTLGDTRAGIPVGYYLLRVVLRNSEGLYTGKSEVVHIYQNLTAETDAEGYIFTGESFKFYLVTTTANSGPGSLRQAVADAAAGQTIRVMLEAGSVIELGSVLAISKSLVIEGNGVTLTRTGSWTNTNGGLLNISGGVTIRRVRFRDGRASYGGAVYNTGTLTLESCIFSGNQAGGVSGSNGGAVYTTVATIVIRGCTFYGNTAGYRSGAVHCNANSGDITLTGNLFDGNTASGYPVANSGTTSARVTATYNVVDVGFGIDAGTAGFRKGTGDEYSAGPLVSPSTFKALSGKPAAGRLPASLPEGYPEVDFYGQTISAGGTAGAVQAVTPAGYSYLEVSVNNGDLGEVSVSPPPDGDGLVPNGSVTLTASPKGLSYDFVCWLQDGVQKSTAPSYNPTISAHTRIRAVFSRPVTVNDFSDAAGSGTQVTLRYALDNAQDGDIITFNPVTPGTTTITLESPLPGITRSVTIEGEGVTLTRSSSWTSNRNSQLLAISGSGAEVTVRRVHFKDGLTAGDGGAVKHNDARLTLESCIFSGSRNTSDIGGAVYSYGSDLVIRGCTFYGNTTSSSGAAVYFGTEGKALTLTGNLFYKNTGRDDRGVSKVANTVFTPSYNIVDAPFGGGAAGCGWTPGGTGDMYSDKLFVSSKTFKVLSGNPAAGRLPETLPPDYPLVDFYGQTISAKGAAGAVQAATAGGYFYLELSKTIAAAGDVSVSPGPDADGLYPVGAIAITAAPNSGYSLEYWVVDGAKTEPTAPNTLSMTLSAHTRIQAVFAQGITVSDFGDTAGSKSQPTLRYALNNAQDGDIITFSGVTPGETTITLGSVLPQITKSIIIEGEGVTLTQNGFPTNSNATQLLYINNAAAEVRISRLHFKGGFATTYGAAIHNKGKLTLESCIFSGNTATNTGSALGGAIYNQTNGSKLTIRGCTFYNNSTKNGGAVYFASAAGSTLILTGNLFYGNTATSNKVVYCSGFADLDASYNAVDLPFGTSSTTQCGWAAGDGDSTLTDLGISGTPIDTTTFVPVTELKDFLPSLPPTDFPATDFYGSPRNTRVPGAVNYAAAP
jgi:hypothetical protein